MCHQMEAFLEQISCARAVPTSKLLAYLLYSHFLIILSRCRQFERTFRYVQSLDMYDAMFLMESDTYPAADGWLDLLVEEVKSSAPFALLGR